MAKSFARRTKKKERNVVDLSESLGRDVFRTTDERLLQGARLQDVYLKKITVKEQVRTKFNDASLKDLAANIKANGLIQPLVLHLEKGKYVLICGERRFRAMTLIKMEKAPCFILENKSAQELMAIQFSENSSREDLHYVDKADGIYNYQKATKASERKIQHALGISKSEVHRSLIIAKLPRQYKEAAKKHNIEKYVLLELDQIPKGSIKTEIAKMVMDGEIKKRTQLKSALRPYKDLLPKAQTKKKTTSKKSAKGEDLSAEFIQQALQGKIKLDAKTKKALKELMG